MVSSNTQNNGNNLNFSTGTNTTGTTPPTNTTGTTPPTNTTNTTNATDIQDNVDQIQQYLELVNAYVGQTNDIALETSLNQAEQSRTLALIEAQGSAALLQINEITSAFNAETDISQLGVRNAILLASKGYESATLIAQIREKIIGLFISVTEQRTNTVWGRVKQLTQGFKF